ncbi:hypothetical protein FQR65_LT16590 [Abscondita terminalis]|nr:hypothetical protein FQR65_LT16590 [Abscondita terminalis]
MKSGSGEDEVYEVSLWYYEKMKFILEHVTARSSIDSIKENDVEQSQQQNEENVTYELDQSTFIQFIDSNVSEDADIDVQSPNISQAMTPTNSNKQKNKKKKLNEEIVLESANNTLQQIAKAIENQNNAPLNNVNHRDDLQTFGDFVVSKLRQIRNPALVNDAQQNIITMLFAAIKNDN